MRKNKNKLKEAVIAITYRCNSRCRMCNIWRQQDFSDELKPTDFNNLPSSLRDINLSGGEPFLRLDLPEIIKIIKKRCSRAKIIISTNGFATDLIIRQMKKILVIDKNIGVAVSIDGMREAHDQIRGIKGGFDKAVKTIKGLKGLGVENLKISFTMGDYNIGELKKVYQLSRELGVEFTSGVIHSSDNYFVIENKLNNRDKIITEYGWLIKKELADWDLKRWARAYFYYGLQEFVRTGKRILPDYAGKFYIFIGPRGNIYSSNMSTNVIGKLTSEFKMHSAKNKDSHNWMMCTVRQSIKKHRLEAIYWIVLNKLKSLLVKLANPKKNCNL